MSSSFPITGPDKSIESALRRLVRPAADRARFYLILLAQIGGLLVLLKISHGVTAINDYYGVVLPVALALAMTRVRSAAADLASVRLLQMIGVIAGGYALIHYPLFPVILPGAKATVAVTAIAVLWVAAVAGGVLCLRWPSLALISATYLVWSKQAVIRVTGLWHGHIIDVLPLAEVSFCLVAGLLVAHVTARIRDWPGLGTAARADVAAASTMFAKVLIAAAISIHLGNYYSSFLAKVTLDDGPFSWLLNNDPGKIFVVGLDNNHVFYAGWPMLVAAMRTILSHSSALTNTLILLGQGIALVGILMPRRGLLLLLLGFDMMHLSIIVLMGANFAPWIMLNLAIAAVVVSRHYERPPVSIGILSVLFILTGNTFMTQAWLGWYDTLANNKMYFEAIDRNGQRHYVPTNFFTFYSYPFAHMAYGAPDAAHAFALDNPNGGTQVFRKVTASTTCDVPVLTASDSMGQEYSKSEINGPAIDAYVRGYHRLASTIRDRTGLFPYALYPHHFFVPLQYAAGFDTLAMADIVAYVYRRESVCFSVQDGVTVRRVVSEAEHRIDLTP